MFVYFKITNGWMKDAGLVADGCRVFQNLGLYGGVTVVHTKHFVRIPPPLQLAAKALFVS